MSYIEAISLLHLLHKVPIKPAKNPPPITPVFPSESYSLPLEKERSLASGLAFLCGIFLDSFSVPALYIHENVRNESLQVFVAINKTDNNDPDNNLQDIRQRLQRVVSRLAVSHQGNNEDEIISAIATMCEEKIKDRMELTKGVDKPLPRLLQIVLDSGSLTKKSKTNTRQLIARIDEYKKHQTVQRLVPIIESAKTLSRTPNFEERVDKIHNKILDPGQRKKICCTLLKVAQYRDTARILYRTAKKFKAARNMEVIAVEPPPETFSFATCTNIDLKSALTRIQALPKHDKDYHRLTKIIKSQRSSAKSIDAQDYFAEWCEKSQVAGKVHSEVQLIAYYEQHRLRPPPRVICASKKACFLCDALIKLHGKVYTPTCHGRLYPGWKLPRHLGLDSQFAHVLEGMAWKSARKTLNENRLIKHPDPFESLIFSSNSSKTTILPLDPEEANGTIVEEVEPDASPELVIVDLKKEEPVIEVHEIAASASPKINEEIAVSECVVAATPSPTRNPRSARLERGTSQTVTITSGSTCKLSSGIVNVHFEYESKNDKKTIDCEVQWLAEPPAGIDVIDAQLLQGELTVGEIICLSAGTEYFLIKLQ